jgi:hypothetical protein
MFFYVLKKLRHVINDIKLDTVLTINKPFSVLVIGLYELLGNPTT